MHDRIKAWYYARPVTEDLSIEELILETTADMASITALVTVVVIIAVVSLNCIYIVRVGWSVKRH